MQGDALAEYFRLVQEFPLVSIKSESQLNEAQRFIDRVFAKGRLEKGEEEYLDALGDLVAAYEDDHHEIESAPDAEMLRHLMESKGISQAELSRETQISKSSISEVLSGKKSFSRQMIRGLADYFRIDPALLAANI